VRAPAPATQAPAPAPAPVAAAPVPPPPPPVRFEAEREFERVVQSQTAGFGVRAEPLKTELSIARKDEVKFNVTPERDGFLYVMATGPDGSLTLLVPNKNSPTVRVKGGQTYRFPTKDGFYIPVGEPLGPSKMLVIVSSQPRRFDAMQPRVDGPVQVFATGDAATAALVAAQGGPSPLAGKPQCPAASPGCADEFGAAVMTMQTVR
jgi:hypothetical protein